MNPITLCGEASDKVHPDLGVVPCGWPAVAPHPIDGYLRPVCRRHLTDADTEDIQENKQ